MRKYGWFVLFLFLFGVSRNISCNPLRLNDDSDGGVGDDGPNVSGDLIVKPQNPTIDVTFGVPTPPTHFTAKSGMGQDVTALAAWTIDDPTLGDLQGSTFTPKGDKAGKTTIRARYADSVGQTTITIKLHATVTDNCPGCPAFPPPGKPSCDASRKPTLIYPPDGPLMPPNMNVIEAQFDKGTGNTVFEVVFSNNFIDIHVATRCNAVSDARMVATNGCSYELSQMVWDVITKTNRGGDPVDISVRAADDSVSCVSTSNVNSIKIAEKDLLGGIYYWQSVTNMGMPGRAGGIFRYDFGKRGQPPDPYLDAASQGRCIGCHFLSADGQQMTYGADDADDDDEYADLTSLLIDVGAKKVSNGQTAPGFQSFSPDHKLIVASDGRGSLSPPAMYLLDGITHAQLATVPTGGMRGTHPDWSLDGKNIVFVRPKIFLSKNFLGSNDDDHFTGASLMIMSADPATKTFGTPTALINSTGENIFYPAFSPDSQFVMYNMVPGTGSTNLAEDSFYNLNARVMLLSLRPGSQPVDMAALNGGKQGYTNSWPRFCPLVQTYKGHNIAWVAFSSTRDYGFRVRNSVQVNSGGKMVDQINCYPPYSPENTGGIGNTAANCHQPQIWMGAIDLTQAGNQEVGGLDSSFPAFWLPFQDLKSHNHTAQWVTKIVTEPPPDGGCIPAGASCNAGSGPCCNGNVCSGNICTVP